MRFATDSLAADNDSSLPLSLQARTLEYSQFSLFPNLVAAFKGVMREIYSLASDPNLKNSELAVAVKPLPGGIIKAGRVVVGDANTENVNAWESINGAHAVIHSHPDLSRDSRGLSSQDLWVLLRSIPIGGLRSIGVLDMNSGQGYMITLDSRIKIPPEFAVNLGPDKKPQSQSDTDIVENWLKQRLYDGTLEVTLVSEFGNTIRPPGFSIDVNGPYGAFRRYELPRGLIKKDTK